jgi:hypothetical protein
VASLLAISCRAARPSCGDDKAADILSQRCCFSHFLKVAGWLAISELAARPHASYATRLSLARFTRKTFNDDPLRSINIGRLNHPFVRSF